jgi:hypothetical protein
VHPQMLQTGMVMRFSMSFPPAGVTAGMVF